MENDIEIISYSILGELLTHGFSTCKDEEAIALAELSGWIQIIDGEIELTEEGAAAYHAALENPYFLSDTFQWSDEALTGITVDGKRSDIDNAVLVGSTHYSVKPDIEGTVDARIVLAECIEEIELSLGLDTAELVDKLKEGAVRQCENGETHWGEFSRDGTGWKTKCKKCRAKEAKERRRLKNGNRSI